MLPQYNYKNITGTTIAQVATGIGVLHTVVLNAISTGGTVEVVDADANGTIAVIASIVDSVGGGAIPATLIYDCVFTRGLKIISVGANDVTVNQSTAF